MQGRMNEGSILIASARKRLELRDYGGSAIVRRSKTPSSIECVLAWQVCCLYVMSKLISCHDHDLNHLGLVFAKLESQETKLKTAKRGHAPAFHWTIHIGGARPPPGPVRRASARVGFLSPPHTRLRGCREDFHI